MIEEIINLSYVKDPEENFVFHRSDTFLDRMAHSEIKARESLYVGSNRIYSQDRQTD